MSVTTDEAAPAVKNGGPKTNYLPILVFLIILSAGGYFGYRYWQNSKLFQTTDDAQVEGDVVSLSAEVPARVKRLHVEDNQVVKKGDVLVELDDSDYVVKVEQAQKALKALDQRQQAAQAQLVLTRQSGDAKIVENQSSIEVAQAAVATAHSAVSEAQERLAQARAATNTARANKAKIQTNIDVARSEAQRLDNDAQRYRLLYKQDEVSRQQLDNAVIAARQAHDKLEAAHRDVQAAQAQISEALAAESQAQEAIRQSQSHVLEMRAKVDEAQGKLLSAQTAPEQVAVAGAQVKVSHADLDQTKSNLKLAQTDLDRCRIVAPCDGVVSKRSALEGTYVQKGSPLLALVATRQLWVIANYKETQMTQIRPGLEVEVDIDSYPGKTFKGKVESIQSGTGARFSLLPPENAAGSFVKVVQRIPVKITFDQPPASDTPLRPGMSVEARVRMP